MPAITYKVTHTANADADADTGAASNDPTLSAARSIIAFLKMRNFHHHLDFVFELMHTIGYNKQKVRELWDKAEDRMDIDVAIRVPDHSSARRVDPGPSFAEEPRRTKARAPAL